MKRLLVIANLRHSSPRIPALLTPLADLGWQSTVVTPPLGKDAKSVLGLPPGFTECVKIASAPYRGDIFWFWRKVFNMLGFTNQISYTEQIKARVGGGRSSVVDNLMRAYQAVFAIPDTEWPWNRSAFKTAQTLFSDGYFDAILSSSPFPTVHRVAQRLKRRYPIQWVADFRDPWSQSHNYSLPWFRQRLDRWMEERTMKTADLITTVSTGFADKLVRIHGQKVRVIRNGYQPLTDSTKVSLPECFTISYTGTIYTGKQDPNKVLVALCNLLESSSISRDRIALNFYGRYDNALQQTIERYGLGKVALQKGNLPREEIRERQRASHLLLLLQWEDPNERGIFPLKFYEYLNAGRPILATGGAEAGEIGAILDQTCAGTTASTIPEIEWALQQAYDAYLKQGTPDYHGIQEVITSYGYVEQARLLDEAIRSLL